MSIKGEKYASMMKKMKHEKGEGKKERMMEYGKPVAKKAVKKAVAKKAVKKK
jgi:hypothetical protein